MLRTRLILWFFLFVAGLTAQSGFRLFDPGIQYLYDNPDYNPNHRTAIATELYGIRVATGTCDSLYTTLEVDPTGDFCVRRVPSPFGTLLCQRADSTVAYFSATDSMVLYPNAAIGFRWLARDSAGLRIYAEVTDESDSVDGTDDRQKTITFSSADGTSYATPLVISQKHGVISSPRLHALHRDEGGLTLAGRSGPDPVGLQLPSTEAYDSVAVGDIFHLASIRATSDCSTCEGYYHHQQFTAEIIDVEESGGSVQFIYRGDYFAYRVPLAGGPATDSVLVRDTVRYATVDGLPEVVRDRQPGEVLSYRDYDMDIYQMVMAYRETCDLPTLRLSTPVSATEEADCELSYAYLDSGPGWPYTAYVPFRLDSIYSMAGPHVSRLVYYEPAEGPSCGSPLDFSDITIGVSTIDAAIDAKVKVFPNPVGGGVAVVKLPVYHQPFTVELYDITGRRLRRRTNEREDVDLNVSSLPAGSYLVVVSTGGQPVARRKLTVY